MNLLKLQSYDPNRLIDALLDKMGIKNDAALAQILRVAPPHLSKIRNKHLPIGATMLLRMHEESGLEIRQLKELMGIQPTPVVLAMVA